MFPTAAPLLVAWTTVSTQSDADALATSAVELGLAACVQIDAPMASIYRWAGKMERAEEFRLTFKFLPAQLAGLEKHVRERHPYETPEWIVVPAISVGEKYLSWARANSSTPPL